MFYFLVSALDALTHQLTLICTRRLPVGRKPNCSCSKTPSLVSCLWKTASIKRQDDIRVFYAGMSIAFFFSVLYLIQCLPFFSALFFASRCWRQADCGQFGVELQCEFVLAYCYPHSGPPAHASCCSANRSNIGKRCAVRDMHPMTYRIRSPESSEVQPGSAGRTDISAAIPLQAPPSELIVSLLSK